MDNHQAEAVLAAKIAYASVLGYVLPKEAFGENANALERRIVESLFDKPVVLSD